MPRAKTITKKAAPRRTRTVRRAQPVQQEERNSFFDYFRLTESYASLILGAIVVIIAAFLLLSFLKNKTNTTNKAKQQISATKTVNESALHSTASQSAAKPGTTYTVQGGESLWTIAEKVYNDGYKWTEIAKANNITSPGMISAGQKLTLPKLETTIAQTTTPAPSPTGAQSPTTNQPSQGQQGQKITGNTYTVVRGDYLWEIAERAYGDGYKWVDIARANNLANPDIIHSGNVFKIPR